ncbi:cytochrome P450 [Amycolatopsis sp.]|uniref:cytochrome P450 n=1 Tax=Amycolatopsis sp. TaxID=37632 RepID=UPI002D7E50AC|nr:cytochrome P450 [Amycolatopsis sp.]HET6704283.1 cytochrome P450 [Amycolatopsis sp.]
MSDDSAAQQTPACPFSGTEPGPEPPARTVPVAPGRLPMIGHIWPLMRNPFDFFADLRARGDVVKLYIGKRPIYFLTTARLAHQVLVKEARSFGKGMVWEAVHPLSGNGLLASDRALHRRQRRLIQPLFHRQMIASYAQIMTAEAQALAESWQPGQKVVVQKAMIELTLTTIVRSMFSGSLPGDVVREIIRSLPIFTYGMVARTVLPAWLCKVSGFDRRFLDAASRLRAAVDHVVRTDKSADGTDLLSHLRAARDPDTGEAMGDDLIRDELVSIMMAGTETTAATLTWAFHELSRHPEVEAKLRAELRDVLGGRPAEYDDIEKLTYTRAVVNEVLRRYSLLMLFRRAEEPVVVDGVPLAAGADVMFSQIDLHRDGAAFPEPDRFHPGRWLVDREHLPHRTAFLPFGEGNRRCIGEPYAQAKAVIALATILGRWRLVPAPGHTVRRVAAAMPRPNSLPMIVTPLNTDGSEPAHA